MKEVETTFRPDGTVDRFTGLIQVLGEPYLAANPYHYQWQTFKATVGLMRLYEDAEHVEEPFRGDWTFAQNTATPNCTDTLVSIPKAEGKVSVRPYVRGKPRRKRADMWVCSECHSSWGFQIHVCPDCGLGMSPPPASNRPQIEPQGDSEGEMIEGFLCHTCPRCFKSYDASLPSCPICPESPKKSHEQKMAEQVLEGVKTLKLDEPDCLGPIISEAE